MPITLSQSTRSAGPLSHANFEWLGLGLLRKRLLLWSLCALTGAILPAHGAGGARIQPVQPRTEFRGNPIGLGTTHPRFSWILRSSRRGEAQTAYQILAASSEDELARNEGNLWDTGKRVSAKSIQVTYAGTPLVSGQRVYWKVRVWDKEGNASAYSAPAYFEMGLLSQKDWYAEWISSPRPLPSSDSDFFRNHPAPLFRKQFVIPSQKRILRARAYISGLGYYELHLNGERVGNQVLDPGWTSYAKRVLYSTYDVTAQLRHGTNVLGAILGNGWFNPLPLRMWGRLNLRDYLTVGKPRLILQLRIDFADGTSQTVVTDPTWKVTGGPILRNSVYLGETYDARRKLPGWDKTGFDDTSWQYAQLAQTPHLGPLVAQSAPPIRITRVFKPVKLTEPTPGVFIFDFKQNFAGWVRLRVKGKAGTRVRLRYGELLYPDGTLDGMTAVCGQIKQGGKDYRYNGVGAPKTAFQQDEYILKGGGPEVYTPRFTFHGFRYVEVTGFPGRPTLNSLEGLGLNADVTQDGSFVCSNPMLNRIQQMVVRTELSNLFSVQSDCPHREKLGYGGDMVASSEMAIFNFDMANFYAKAVRDLIDAVRPNGGFTETSPYVGISDSGLGGNSGPVGWGTAEPVLIWQLYKYYGDERLMRENYSATKRWIALLTSCAKNGILDNGLSDHESLVPKPRRLTGTAFYYRNVELFSRMARALGHERDAEKAESLLKSIKTAFNRNFLHSGTGRYDTGTQACQAFALHFGLVPTRARSRAVDWLVHDIEDVRHGHLSTGIFGTKYMLEALAEAGQSDVVYQIVNQRTFPGWGYMLEHGATTLWEHWAFSDNVYSHNHPMFGSVSEWFYKVLAGIEAAPDAVGFNKIVIAPQPVGDLKWVRAHYDSVHGRIVSHWERHGRQFKLQVTIPVGVNATVVVPAESEGEIQESGRPLRHVPEIRFLRMAGKRAVLAVEPGRYEFTSQLPPSQ